LLLVDDVIAGFRLSTRRHTLDAACKAFNQWRRVFVDKQRFDKGLAARKAVLGDEYVERSLHAADDFNREFQELVTEYCWGTTWGDESLDYRQRSLLNLGMIAALNRMQEWELHFRGAIRNGWSRDELRSVLIHIAVYCGIPTGVECFRIARKVLAELEAESS
jgi:4-carboxymuconolactone decarboxylase